MQTQSIRPYLTYIQQQTYFASLSLQNIPCFIAWGLVKSFGHFFAILQKCSVLGFGGIWDIFKKIMSNNGSITSIVVDIDKNILK